MEWQDDGVVIGVRRHGESSTIVDLLTRHHGRHVGFVHGGRSRRLRPCLQPGNGVSVVWRARLEEQMGSFTVEPRLLRAARLMDSALALNAVNHLCALVRLLPEREPHDEVYDALEAILDRVEDRAATPAAMVRFALAMLAELGFRLDLERCAATGSREDLVYVSPKSGRAVCRAAGEPYRARLLPLPLFLLVESAEIFPGDLAAAFRLAEFFLLRDVFAPRGLTLSDGRGAYLKRLDLLPPRLQDGP